MNSNKDSPNCSYFALDKYSFTEHTLIILAAQSSKKHCCTTAVPYTWGRVSALPYSFSTLAPLPNSQRRHYGPHHTAARIWLYYGCAANTHCSLIGHSRLAVLTLMFSNLSFDLVPVHGELNTKAEGSSVSAILSCALLALHNVPKKYRGARL